ncbi:tetratricopeptide repeat protein [bacterium]|nr:tetratricopeptide repeat protein [bacterium]
MNAFKQEIHDSLEYYYDGESLERQRDFSGAAEAYKKSIEISPRPRAYYRLAMVTMADGDYEAGEAYLRKAVKLSPSFAEAKQRIEMLQDRKGSADIDPNSPWAPRAGDANAPDAPMSEVRKPVQSQVKPDGSEIGKQPIPDAPAQPDEKAALEQSAFQSFQGKNWQQALPQYLKLTEADPQNALYFYRLGYAQQQIGLSDEAVKSLEKAVELNPSFAAAWNDLGITYETLGQSSDAVGAYQNAIAKGPENGAYYNLAVLMEKQGEYKEAISLYEKFIAAEGAGDFKERAQAQMEKLRRYAY